MKKLLVVFFLCRLITVNAEEGIQFFKGTFSEALVQANEQHKLLFVDCFTTWCGPCKWMSAHVFTDEAVMSSFNKNFICLELDMEKGEGLTIAKKYNVKNYPTYLWIDPSGKQVHRSVGSTSSEEFLVIAGKAMDPTKNLSYMKNQYETGNREQELLLNYASSLKTAYDMSYQTVADEYFRTLPEKDLTLEKNWNAIRKFTPNINSYTYEVMTRLVPSFNEHYGKDSVQAVFDELAISSLSFARQQKDSVMLKKAVAKLKESNNMELFKEGMTEEMNYYKGNKNYSKYAELAHDYINKHFLDDPKKLNAVCWTYFQHINDKEQLAEAEKWIAQSVALEDMYYNTDTYANLLKKLGKKKEAIVMANHAITLAKKEGQDFSSSQDLLNDLMNGD